MKAPAIESINYSIELSIEEFKRLEYRDYLTEVDPKLIKAGAWNVEYNGHYGAAIYFSANPKDLKRIEKIVKNLIK